MTSEYQKKQAFLKQVISVYGRKPVLEVLEDFSLDVHKLHLADSNKPSRAIDDLIKLANARNVEIAYHSKQALSRISKNGKQDQGVVVDVLNQKQRDLSQSELAGKVYIGLDNVTNPQNVGMIIRSATAAGVDGIIIPVNGNAALGPLVIKSSAGTLFKAPILRCDSSEDMIEHSLQHNIRCVGLAGEGTTDVFQLFSSAQPTLYIVGNETDGIDTHIKSRCDLLAKINMNNGVESLNVAVAASVVAFGAVNHAR
jgi:23S rRNA (guanosine2251-2'-O)-methyltransferase